MSPSPRFQMNPISGGSPKSPLNKQDIILIVLIIQIILLIVMWVDLRSDASNTTTSTVAQTTTGDKTPQTSASDPATTASTSGTQSKTVIDPFRDIQSDIVRVQISNGCGVSGLAVKARTWMEKNGYDVRDVGNADRQDYSNSQIIIRTGNVTAANILASKLGVNANNIKTLTGSASIEVDLTLVIGSDYKRLTFAR